MSTDCPHSCHGHGANNAAVSSAASPCIPDSAWLCVSIVTVIVECPGSSWTTLTCTPGLQVQRGTGVPKIMPSVARQRRLPPRPVEELADAI